MGRRRSTDQTVVDQARFGAVGVVVAVCLGAAVGSGCGPTSNTDELDLDALPRLRAEAEIRIGSVDDPDVGFSQVRGVDVDRDGNIYVFESQDMQIRVYTPDGRLSRRIGQRGEGPGEFQRVGRFGVVGDTVWTFDSAGDRITLFDRSGYLLSTGRAAPAMIPVWGGGYGYVLPWEMRADGLFSSRLSRISGSRSNPAPEVGDTEAVPVPHLLFDATGAIVDTVGWDERPPPRMARPPSESEEFPDPVVVGGRPYMVPRPPTELPQWVALPDGRVELSIPLPASDDAFFTVTRISLSGDTLYQRRLRYQPTRYTSADLDALAANASRGMMMMTRGEAVDPAVEPRLRAAMDFPEFRPATQWAQADNDERLWMVRDASPGSTSRWIVLAADGLPLGELELPGTFQFMWSSEDVLWGVELDELDVPWLVRYRVDL